MARKTCKKQEKTDWGIIYYYNGFTLYSYDDDKDIMYLSEVYVKPSKRGHGHGNRILDLSIREARKLGYTTICLRVLESSWVHDWYESHGYDDFYREQEYIWMKRGLE